MPSGAEAISELAGRDDGHALRPHDADVVALRQLDPLEQRHEAFFFDIEQRTETAVRAVGPDRGLGEIRFLQFQSFDPLR